MGSVSEAAVLHVLRFLIFAFCIFAVTGKADELYETVHYVTEQAERDGATMALPVNDHVEEGLMAAQEVIRAFSAPEAKERRQCVQKRIDGVLGPADTPAFANPASSLLAADEQLYLFFSSSMPDQTVHAYIKAMATVHDQHLNLVMKGKVPGQKDDYLARIIKHDLACQDQLQRRNPELCERYDIPIHLEPSLFEAYAITQVPALVFVKGDDAWKIVGDATLSFLLERIDREANSTSLTGVVNSVRGKHE